MKVLKLAEFAGECPEFEAELPFGAKLYSKGGCLYYEPPEHVPPDGVYNRLVVVDGRITDAIREDYVHYEIQDTCFNDNCHGA